MIQQGQVFELKRASRGRGPPWAYRYRVGGRGSRRVQRGGFASEEDAAAALERELERVRRSTATTPSRPRRPRARGGRRTLEFSPRAATETAVKQGEDRSPLTDSNRRPLLTILGQTRKARAGPGHGGQESAANRANLTLRSDARVDACGPADVRTSFARSCRPLRTAELQIGQRSRRGRQATVTPP
jgi:hypothetical protein